MADYTIPTTPLKRLRYYNNQFLTEKDFIDDQAAHLAHERAQLRALCAPGVWEGLVVSYAAVPTTSAPTVGVGIAVDVQGRLIVLDPQAAGPAPATLANGNYLLSIQYSEIATDLSINTGGSAGTADNTRFTSLPVLSATVASAVPAGAVVLGSLTVTAGQITARSDAGRQYAGLRLPGPVLAGNPPPQAATLTNRNDGSADGAQLTGTLTVLKTSAAAIGPSVTLNNPNAAPGGANAGGAIYFNSYDPGANAPGARIQSLGDANFSSHLSISTKTPGAIGNPLVERLRITSSGVAQFTGAVTAPSLTAATFSGPPLTAATFTGAVQFNGAVTTTGQVVSRNTVEANVAPLVLNRDFLGNNRSLIDHNGYRMGEVSEIDENWKLAGTRTALFSAVPVNGGGKTTANGYDLSDAAYTVIGPLPVGATVISLVVQSRHLGGQAQPPVHYALNDHHLGVSTIIVGKDMPSQGDMLIELAESASSGGLPYTVNAQTKLTIDVGVPQKLISVYGFVVTYIMDPPGWAWTTASQQLFAQAQFNRLAMRRYQDPTAALGLNQRSVNIASPFNTAAPGEEGSLTTEGYEAFMDANICYVQEWICRTGTISDAVNARSFKLGVQNANAGANDRFIYFFNENTTADWQLRIVGSTTADNPTGVAIAANTPYRMRLEILGGNVSSAGDNAFRIRGFINGTKVVDVPSTTLPAADMIRPFFAAGVTATGSIAYDFSVGRVRRVWNHQKSSDSL